MNETIVSAKCTKIGQNRENLELACTQCMAEVTFRPYRKGGVERIYTLMKAKRQFGRFLKGLDK